MSKRVITAVLLLSFLYGINSSFAAFFPENSTKKQIIENETNLKGYSLFVPANTTCNAILATEINSKSTIVGQTIKAILAQDFIYQDTVIASEGSIINGSIVTNKAPTKDTPLQIQIKFTTIKTPYNNIIPINATIAMKDMEESTQNIVIPANSQIEIIFEQPITLGVQ